MTKVPDNFWVSFVEDIASLTMRSRSRLRYAFYFLLSCDLLPIDLPSSISEILTPDSCLLFLNPLQARNNWPSVLPTGCIDSYRSKGNTKQNWYDRRTIRSAILTKAAAGFVCLSAASAHRLVECARKSSSELEQYALIQMNGHGAPCTMLW